MSATGFPVTRVLFMAAAGLLSLLGLFMASRAVDIGIAIFGFGLLGFGLAFGLWMLHRGLSALYGGPH